MLKIDINTILKKWQGNRKWITPGKPWLIFLAVASVSLSVWAHLTFPQLTFINLSVDQKTAVTKAEEYLVREQGIRPNEYHRAVVLRVADNADVYLQRALGFQGETDFFQRYNFELFSWKIRLFKEQQKEEFLATVSAATGEVTSFYHTIDDTAERTDDGQENAALLARHFLTRAFGFNFRRDFLPHAESSQKFDNRRDYSFQWARRDVKIPWSHQPDQDGTAKLLTAAIVSGKDLLFFNKQILDIPDHFTRYLEKQRAMGNNLMVILRAVFLIILIFSVYFVSVQRNTLILNHTRRFALGLSMFFFGLILINYLNNYQNLFFNYPTTIPLPSFLWQNIGHFVINAFVSSLIILMPCLAGETLHNQYFPEKAEGGFLHYLHSTFLSRHIAGNIFFGYLVAIILLGTQSALFAVGQKYFGVWVEQSWLVSLSGSVAPWFTAFFFALTASLSEEILFRVFGISLAKKFLKSTFWAVIFSSLAWGFGHSTYPIYPMWFRGFEVTILGFILAWVYLRYGLICVLVAHYIFDAFWYGSAYLFGKTTAFYFYSILGVLTWPMLWAVFAYLINRQEIERPHRWYLNPHQLFNVEVLKKFLRTRGGVKADQLAVIKEEVIAHGWDPAVVETALEDILQEGRKD